MFDIILMGVSALLNTAELTKMTVIRTKKNDDDMHHSSAL